jgi:hypothetical protein
MARSGPSFAQTRLARSGPSFAQTRLARSGPSFAQTRLARSGPSFAQTRLARSYYIADQPARPTRPGPGTKYKSILFLQKYSRDGTQRLFP